MGKYDAIKQACYKANMQLPELDLVLFTFGNVSAADQKSGVFAIKPSGVPYDQLEVKDMVVVDFDNNLVEGNLNPSSDTKTHALLYKNWKHIHPNKCILHFDARDKAPNNYPIWIKTPKVMKKVLTWVDQYSVDNLEGVLFFNEPLISKQNRSIIYDFCKIKRK